MNSQLGKIKQEFFKSLEEIKAHVKDLWVDPSYLDTIYNSGKWPVAPKNNPLNLNL